MRPRILILLTASLHLALPPLVAVELGHQLTATELYEQGSAAFKKGDYPTAERHFSNLQANYAENPDVKLMITEAMPMLAFCAIKNTHYEPALEAIDAALPDPSLPPAVREDLLFWRGLALMQTGATQAAQEQFGEFYANEKHAPRRRYEAFLLFAQGYVNLQDYDGAADFLAWQLPKVPLEHQEIASRGAVLWLHSAMESRKYPAAVEIVKNYYPRLVDMSHIVAFQLLTFQLGGECFAADDFVNALHCWHRLWPMERLVVHQEKQIAALKARVGKARSADTAEQETRMVKELDELKAMKDYDIGRQLRLAQTFMALQRWREAAMVLDAAVKAEPLTEHLQQAARSAIQCWEIPGAHDKVLASAESWLAKCKDQDPAGIPLVLMAKAEALRSMGRLEEAERAFGDLANDFPEHESAARALFLGGMCQLDTDRNPAALDTFHALRRRFKEGPLHEDAFFWEAVALSIERDYDEALAQFAGYEKAYPEGRYLRAAAFETARCLHNQLKHGVAAKALQNWLSAWPDGEQQAEAKLLLGGSLLAIGDMEEGMQVLRSVGINAERIEEEAQFTIGRALLKLERLDEATAHWDAFLAAHPRSWRLAEAASERTKILAKQGKTDEARKRIWQTLLELGADAGNQGVEDLLLGMDRLYPGKDERAKLQKELHTVAQESAAKPILAIRLRWAAGTFLKHADLGKADGVFYDLAEHVDPKSLDARVLIDCADALRRKRNPYRARKLYEAIRKWHPRAVEKDRTSLGLGLLSLVDKDSKQAAEWFERCSKESVSGEAAAEAQVEQATLLASERKWPAVTAVAEKVTGNRLAGNRLKARALLLLAEAAMQQGEVDKAAAHYGRCALSCAKQKDLAALAWWQQGLALEKAGKSAEAVTTWQLLADNTALASEAPVALAKQRLAELHGR